VIGVVQNFYYGDLTEGIQPLFHLFDAHHKLANYLGVRVKAGHEQAVARKLAAGFRAARANPVESLRAE
jgi:hypothetical protein